mmetsp:Transcript_8242/g.13348  ORF Transcript_8242/g.13348 Transcript_8242/m.13348 type:complete len:286 (+) Transcript_8242:75-932(+)
MPSSASAREQQPLTQIVTNTSAETKNKSYGATTKRDLARRAFKTMDVEASKKCHQNAALERHNFGGDRYIKSAVFGGLDGIITTFATVTTVAGAKMSSTVILILGIAHLFADGISMGLGDYTSTVAEQQLVRQERKREEWEYDTNKEAEIEEMVDLYEKKGVSRADAQLVMTTLAKYKDPFIDMMMFEELQMNPYDDDDALMGGVITLVAFVLFGSVPLLSYVIALVPGIEFSSDSQLHLSLGLTALTMFILGAVKGSYIDNSSYQDPSWWLSGSGSGRSSIILF